MKALSLTQPWATLIVTGAKRVETRSWPTKHRGWIAIHASKSWSASDRDFAECQMVRDVLVKAGVRYVGPHDHGARRYRYVDGLPLGSIVGFAYVEDCHPTEAISRFGLSEQERAFGNYDDGRFGWFFREAGQLTVPVPCRGALGLWTVPDNVLTETP